MAKVLVVDDEPGMRQVVLNVLKTEGHQLFSAEDGKQAIEQMTKEHPNLVLLDMRLPDMDGLEILAEIKKISPDTAVIMLSGFGDVEYAVGAMKQGAFDYISKPFKVNEVIAVVKKALGTQSISKDGMIRKGASEGDAGTVSVKSSKGMGSLIKFALIGVIAVSVLGVGGFFALKFLSPAAKDKVFTVPYSNPTSITFDGQYLWVTDWYTQSFYKHNVDEMLSTAQVYYLQDSHPTGVTFDGKYIWSSDSWEKKIYKHKLDGNLSIIDTFESPCPEPSGLYWDGVYMWICDLKEGKIYQTKVTDDGLATINVYESPGNNPIGIFSDGKNYWVGDSGTSKIYKLDSNFKVSGVYSAPQFEDSKTNLTGIAWDGKSVWTSSDGSQKIYRNSFKSFKKLNF